VLGAYTWVLIWSLSRVHRRLPRVPMVIAAPLVWGGWEVLRGQVAFDGYPWFLAAHPLIDAPRVAIGRSLGLADLAAWVGVYGVSVAIVVLSAAALDWRSGSRRPALVALGGVVVVWAASGFIVEQPTDRTVRVAVVQTNVPQSVKDGWSLVDRIRTLDSMIALSKEAATHGPDLIVWPETMFPGIVIERAWVKEFADNTIVWGAEASADEAEALFSELEHVDEIRWRRRAGPDGDEVSVEIASFADAVVAAQKTIGVPILVGATGYDRYELGFAADGTIDPVIDGPFNSSFLVRGGRVQDERYDKMHLTPFGEVMPYISAWPWLESTLLRIGVGASGMSFDLRRGDRATVFAVDAGGESVRVVTPICFEATNPHVCRRLAYGAGGRRADLIAQMTNDGWFFGRDAVRIQHLQIARWRCVELGLPLIRAANTGISAAISPDGTSIEPVGTAPAVRTEGLLIADIGLGAGGTVYGVIGGVVSWVLLGAGCVLVIASFAVGRTGTETGQQSASDA